ncbi:MAG: cell division protein FtsA [Bacteroidetes bacterium GWF2_43_63]|nr:MAG: cell division protein FtsA [Bacteroidetes bacterium GWE2_42_42]OFY55251.1 MAG: cell division protein FtsA [Bacteroidetes bacterium GWF2_43_63]HBG70866.1 cell division protein FtsA [Bacteroidales bacterium]HCB63370.1 cell division protein FtsA [Bacteroidales bacterium]HCY23073.1 cell division protein FtsA [Bacteroidales bacterium]
MNENHEIMVGLDIGTTKIAMIVGYQNEHGKLEILGYGKTESLGVKRGLVANIEKTVEAIKKVVEITEAKSNVNIRTVNVGIAGQHIKSLQHRGSIIRDNTESEIGQEDVERLIENMYKLVMPPGEEIIHVIPQEYIVDGEQGIKDPVGMAGVQLEANFHIITGQITAARNIEKCITRADISMSDMVLEPIASSYSVLSEEEKEAGVALVDIGGGTTDIAIFQDGIIRHSAVIPLGGDIVTEDVKEGCSILKSYAETLKVKHGSALANEVKDEIYISIPGLKGRPHKEISMKNLARIIQSRMEEIIEFVNYEIKNSGYDRRLIAGIVLTGGGAQLKDIAQLCQFITGHETRIGYPSEHLSANVDKELLLPMYATCIGLVLNGIENSLASQSNSKKIIPNQGKRERGGFIKKIFRGGMNFFDENIS